MLYGERFVELRSVIAYTLLLGSVVLNITSIFQPWLEVSERSIPCPVPPHQTVVCDALGLTPNQSGEASLTTGSFLFGVRVPAEGGGADCGSAVRIDYQTDGLRSRYRTLQLWGWVGLLVQLGLWMAFFLGQRRLTGRALVGSLVIAMIAFGLAVTFNDAAQVCSPPPGALVTGLQTVLIGPLASVGSVVFGVAAFLAVRSTITIEEVTPEDEAARIVELARQLGADDEA